MTITLRLPVPPRCLSPNSRPHYHAKGRATKKARTRAKVEVMAMLPAGYRPRAACAKIKISWFHKTGHRMDATNCIGSCKAYEDGICDAGLILNDSGVTWLPVEQFTDKTNPRVELTVEI